MLDFSTNLLRTFGIGKAKSGTEHLREMKVSSLLLLILIPLFVFTFGSIVGESHADVTLYFERPLPSLICALTIIVGFAHFKSGVIVAIEDYSRGTIAKILISGVTALSYAGMAIGLYAIAKMVF